MEIGDNSLFVDAHFHVWDLASRRYLFPTEDLPIYKNYLPADLWNEMKSTPVKNAVLVQVCNDGGDETSWFLEQANQHRFIKGIVTGLDFMIQDVEEKVKEISRNPKIVGVRQILNFEPDDWLRDPKFKRGLALLEKYNIPFDLLAKTPNFVDVPELVESFPKLKIVIDHLAKPNFKMGGTSGWAEGMSELAKYPNIFCKLSGMVTEADLENWKVEDFRPSVRHVISEFKPERCMFGSDWPVCKLANAKYLDVFELLRDTLPELSKHELQGIFGENAAKFYNLQDLDY